MIPVSPTTIPHSFSHLSILRALFLRRSAVTSTLLRLSTCPHRTIFGLPLRSRARVRPSARHHRRPCQKSLQQAFLPLYACYTIPSFFFIHLGRKRTHLRWWWHPSRRPAEGSSRSKAQKPTPKTNGRSGQTNGRKKNRQVYRLWAKQSGHLFLALNGEEREDRSCVFAGDPRRRTFRYRARGKDHVWLCMSDYCRCPGDYVRCTQTHVR